MSVVNRLGEPALQGAGEGGKRQHLKGGHSLQRAAAIVRRRGAQCVGAGSDQPAEWVPLWVGGGVHKGTEDTDGGRSGPRPPEDSLTGARVSP